MLYVEALKRLYICHYNVDCYNFLNLLIRRLICHRDYNYIPGRIMTAATLTKYGTFFTVSHINSKLLRENCENFKKGFAQWDYGKKPNGGFGHFIGRYYAVHDEARDVYRFHRNCYGTFCKHIAVDGFTRDKLEIIEVPFIEPTPIKLVNHDDREPTEAQKKVIDFFREYPSVSKLVTMQTGKGKSLVLTQCMLERQQRIVVIVRSMYMNKWKSDIRNQFGLTNKEVCVISGSKELGDLIAMGPEDTRFKAVIISNKTIKSWLTQYERLTDAEFKLRYDILPEQLLESLGANTYYVDERHLDLHLNFLMDLYFHAKEVLCATATFTSKRMFILRMMDVMHPVQTRINPLEYDAYMKTRCIFYRFQNPDNIRTTEYGSPNYNHGAFEKSILRLKRTKQAYYELVEKILQVYYLKESKYLPGDKCIVFFYSVDMCTDFVNWLSKRKPTLKVMKFTHGDPDSVLVDGDVIVSTVIKLGTAQDLKQLTTVVRTQALDSVQGILQTLGRLRKLPDGRTPYYIYFACEQMEKHLEYNENAMGLFKELGVEQRGVVIPGLL
jgi:hypothetical protein